MKAILNWLSGPLLVFFQPLVTLFANIFNPLIGICLALWSLFNWITETLGLGGVKLQMLRDKYTLLHSAVSGYIFGMFPEQIGAPLAWINYAAPITESLVFLGMLCLLYTLATAVRMLKSIIPTVA